MNKFVYLIICLFFSCYSRAQDIPWISLIPAQKIHSSPLLPPTSPEGIDIEVNRTINTIWEFYKINFKRELNDDEHTHRFSYFHSNVVRIMKHNKAYEQGLVDYRMGLNEFTDKSEDELAHLRGLKVPKHSRRTGSTFLSSVSSHFLPSSVDWRLVGAVTEVKNQGHCGSCWAFSTTGAVEGQHYRKFKKLVNLSEQQLVDCSKANHGCQGGIMDAAFQYVRESGGLDSEEEYPYVSGQSGESNNCTFHKEDVVATVSGFIDLPKSDEDALKEAVALHGPISVAINAGEPSFMSYHSGVYSDPDCDDNLDHGVLLVGYGEERGIPYWLIKNSWGEQWGDQGYVKIKRNADNMCGVASMASYPLV